MLKDNNPEVKAGILIFCALVVLFAFTFMIGKFHVFKKGYTIDISFNFVEGLDVGAPVRLSGVKAGNVSKVRLDPEKNMVVLTLWLQDEAKIRDDSRFYINTLGFMGEKYIEIDPGVSPTFIKPGSFVEGEPARRLEEILKTGQEIATQANDIIGSIKGVTDKISLDKLSASLDELHKLMKELDKNGTVILKNVKSITTDVNDITSSKKDDLKVSITKLRDTLTKLDITVANLNEVLVQVKSGQGAVGALLYDPKMEKDLKEAISNFRDFSKSIKDNPGQLIWGGKKQ
jgi:phospholipid/cholesterol/gamma-HCH transport system substrate-binding protein